MIQELAQEILQGTGVGTVEDSVTVHSAPPILQTRLRAAETCASVLSAQAMLINHIWKMRTGRSQTASFDLQGASLAMQSVFYQRIWDYPIALPEPDYPTVGMYPTKDGRHVMIDGGYPLLRNGLLDLLDCGHSTKAVGQAILGWDAAALEQAIADRKLPGVMVRSQAEWLAHPQGKYLAEQPVIELIKIGEAPIEGFPIQPSIHPAAGLRPLTGIKILDLTHVIAGPTSAKALASKGATPLHIYSPHRATLPPFDIDTGHGKLSAFLDIKQDAGKKKLLELASEADVFAQSYRPGSVSEMFPPEKLAEVRPGIIYLSISCFGFDGPWHHHPGWEQLAQSVSGIAVTEGSEQSPTLTKLFFPNDYLTGHLAATGVLAALIRRATEGGSWHVRVSLTRTAMMLMQQGLTEASATTPVVPVDILQRYMVETDTGFGRLHSLGSIVRYSDTTSRWDLPVVPLGTHQAAWPEWLSVFSRKGN